MNPASQCDLPPGFRMLETLGQGGEGTVYLVSKDDDAHQYVLKVFHEPLPKAWAVGLQIYASNVSPNDHGLLPIQLWENSEAILGVYYPYTRLTAVHRRLIRASDQIAQSMVGSFCRMQHHLISSNGIGLLEPAADHLMLDRHGRFTYIDFGYGISTLDNQEARRLNLFGYGLAAFLPSLCGKNLRAIQPPVDGHVFDQPCVYFSNPLFDQIAVRQEWLASIIAEVRSSPSSQLLNADFYLAISSHLPGQPPLPQMVTALSRLLEAMGHARMRARAMVAP